MLFLQCPGLPISADTSGTVQTTQTTPCDDVTARWALLRDRAVTRAKAMRMQGRCKEASLAMNEARRAVNALLAIYGEKRK
jgi:hypothetical protein